MEPVVAAKAVPPTEWKRRRRVVFGTLLFCAAAVIACYTYAVTQGSTNPILETIVTMSYMLAGTTAAAYCGFATWDDKARNDAIATLMKKGS